MDLGAVVSDLGSVTDLGPFYPPRPPLLSEPIHAALSARYQAFRTDELGVSFIDLAESKIRQQIEKASSLETPELRETVFQTQKSLRDLKMSRNQDGTPKFMRGDCSHHDPGT